MTREEKARESIDRMLCACGWAIQTKDKINLSESRGVALCEFSFASGEPDSPSLPRTARLRQSILQNAFSGKLNGTK